MESEKPRRKLHLYTENGNRIRLECLEVLASGNTLDYSRRCEVKRITYQIFCSSHMYVICDIRDGHSTITHWNKRITSRNSIDLKDHLGKSAHLINEIPSNLSQ